MGQRTFTADTTEEAMDLVRRELGEEAVILDIKRVPAGKGKPAGERIQVRVQLPGTPEKSKPVTAESAGPEMTQQLHDLAEALRDTHARLELLSAGMGWLGALSPDLPEGVSRLITDGLVQQIPTSGGIHLGERRQVVALVGPSGVGKTTVAGKLGWQFAREAGRRVGMITTDTLHIGALERVRLICKWLDIPIEIVYTAEEAPAALERLADVELLLVDLPGGSPRNPGYIEETRELLALLDPAEVHLVVSAATGSAAIRDMLRGYAPLQPDQLILTKVDEAPGLYDLLPFLPGSGLALSYLSVNAEIGGGLLTASGDVLSHLLLGDALPPAQTPVMVGR